MTIHISQWVKTSLFAAAALLTAGPALAAYPERPVTIIVGYGAGGGVDTLARLYAERLSEALDGSFIVQNKAGAGATLATAEVARAKPDGYTLTLGPTAVYTITPHVRKVNYDPLKDFQPISMVATGHDVVLASNALGVDTLEEFIALAKAEPMKYSFASSGIATSTHLIGEVFAEAAGIELLHVPYKSSSEYLPDLIEGRVSLAFDPVLISQATEGQITFLGVAAEERFDMWPDVGTTKEAGLDLTRAQDRLWYGMFAPAGTPEDIVNKIAEVIDEASKDPRVIETLAASGIRASSLGPDEFAEKVKETSEYYEQLLDDLGVELQH